MPTTHGSVPLVTLLLLLCMPGVAPRPLEEYGSPAVTPETGAAGDGCVHELQPRIERCLERYEQILVTYQAMGTSQQQRRRLRARFCHQYQVTLQCLHESLMQCPPQPEHLRLIEVRLGYLKGFMHATCNPGRPEDLTPQPTTPTPATTPTTTMRPTTTTTQPTTTRPTTTRRSRSSNRESAENNSLKGYTVNSDDAAAVGRGETTTTVAPPGVRGTSQPPPPPTKFQLLFGYHGTKATASQSEMASNKVGLDHGSVHKSSPVRIISIDGHNDRDTLLIQGKQISEQLDCTIDDNNKIDVRCIFSGSQRLNTTWLSVSLTVIFTYLSNHCR